MEALIPQHAIMNLFRESGIVALAKEVSDAFALGSLLCAAEIASSSLGGADRLDQEEIKAGYSGLLYSIIWSSSLSSLSSPVPLPPHVVREASLWTQMIQIRIERAGNDLRRLAHHIAASPRRPWTAYHAVVELIDAATHLIALFNSAAPPDAYNPAQEARDALRAAKTHTARATREMEAGRAWVRSQGLNS